MAANRFHETLIANSISQSDNRKTEASLWRFWPYLLVQPKPLFLGRVVFNTVTMPCSLNTDNDSSQRCIPAVKSGARLSDR